MMKDTSEIIGQENATRIEAGMKPKTLQQILGHSNIGITMNLYVHITEDEKLREINLVADALCNFDKYDIVIGPVADDNMAMLFRQYGGNYDKKKNTCHNINLLYDVVGGGDNQCTDDICGCRQDGGGQP